MEYSIWGMVLSVLHGRFSGWTIGQLLVLFLVLIVMIICFFVLGKPKEESSVPEQRSGEKNKKIPGNLLVQVILLLIFIAGIVIVISRLPGQQFSETTVPEEEVREVTDEQSVADAISQEEKTFENVTVSDLTLTEEKYVIAVGDPVFTEQIEVVNQVIDIMQEEGTLRQICDNYFADGTRKPIASKELDDEAHQLVVATCADYAPFEYKEDEEYYGVDLEIASWLTAALGRVELVVRDMQYDNVLLAVSAGECDIAVSAIPSDKESPENVVYSNSYFDASKCVAVRKNDLHFESWDIDDTGAKLSLSFSNGSGTFSILIPMADVFSGVEQGMGVGFRFEENVFSDAMIYDTPALALEALQAGEIDFVIGQATPLNYLVNSSDSDS